MPCRCDYMEPTQAEVRMGIANQLNTLENYDFSEVHDQLSKNGSLGEATAAITQYKKYWRDVILLGQEKTPSPSKLADIALHTHILLREDFGRFQKKVLQGSFSHLPEESRELTARELPVASHVLISYLSSETGAFRGNQERAQGALDAYLLERAGGSCSKKQQKEAASISKLIRTEELVTSGVLDHDLDFLRRYLIQEGQAFQDNPKKAQEMIYSYLKFMINVGSDGGKPSADIRSVWEAHQLHTEDYQRFAKRYTSNPTYRPA
jgi:hypothetical protein